MLAPLPVAVPLAGAATVLGLNAIVSRRAVQVLAAASAVAEVALAIALVHQTNSGTIVYWFGGWTPRAGAALGISFSIDQLGAGASLLAGVTVTAAIATTQQSVDEAAGVAYALLLMLLAAMTGFCLAGDLFNMFVFFELVAVSAFALTAYHSTSREALRGALNFAMSNTIGAFLVLIGIALLYSRTGALNLAQIGNQLAAAGRADRLTIVALALLLAGFLIRAAVVPFHFWLIDTAPAAPLPVAIILAGALDTLGVYAVARIYWTVFATSVDGHQRAVGSVLVAIGTLSATVGGALAVAFRDPRRRLAFVMVAHSGILLIGVGCLSPRGVAASVIFAAGDGTAIAALWVGLALLGRTLPSHDERPLPSRSRSTRRAGQAVLTLAALATAGFPLFATGLGNSAISEAAQAAGYTWVTPVIVIVAALTGAAMLHTAWPLGATSTGSSDARPAASARPSVVLGGCGIALLVASSAAALLGRWAASAGARFANTAAYQQRVLNGIQRVPPDAAPTLRSPSVGLVVDLLGVGAAIIIAAALALTRGDVRRTRTLQAVIRRAHDGSINDSATWLTVGTATIALILAVTLR